MNQPVMVMNQNAKRETGSIARANNIAAAKAVSDIIRTTLGPRSMLKMILDASGGALHASRARAIRASNRVGVIRARAQACVGVYTGAFARSIVWITDADLRRLACARFEFQRLTMDDRVSRRYRAYERW